MEKMCCHLLSLSLFFHPFSQYILGVKVLEPSVCQGILSLSDEVFLRVVAFVARGIAIVIIIFLLLNYLDFFNFICFLLYFTTSRRFILQSESLLFIITIFFTDIFIYCICFLFLFFSLLFFLLYVVSFPSSWHFLCSSFYHHHHHQCNHYPCHYSLH